MFNSLTIYSLLGDADLMAYCPVEVRQAGTWTPLLQCCKACTWTHLKQQNKKKLYGSKDNCVHVQLGQMLKKRHSD